jgi:hypothetical protein
MCTYRCAGLEIPHQSRGEALPSTGARRLRVPTMHPAGASQRQHAPLRLPRPTPAPVLPTGGSLTHRRRLLGVVVGSERGGPRLRLRGGGPGPLLLRLCLAQLLSKGAQLLGRSRSRSAAEIQVAAHGARLLAGGARGGARGGLLAKRTRPIEPGEEMATGRTCRGQVNRGFVKLVTRDAHCKGDALRKLQLERPTWQLRAHRVQQRKTPSRDLDEETPSHGRPPQPGEFRLLYAVI